jgi:hydrogenase maturation protein HypF
MALEFHSDKEIDKQYPVDLSADMEIEIGGLLNAILNDIRSGVPVSVIGGGFHNWLSNVILEISSRLRKKTGINKVVLSGGVFQNKLLLNKTKNLLRHCDFEVFYNRIVPPNDGGISFGQIGHYIYSR